MADGGLGGNLQDLVSTQKSGVNYLGRLVTLLSQLLPRVTGTFTMTATTTLAVANTNIAANSIVSLTPTNASAGTMQGSSKHLYIQSVTSGVGFTVATADATNGTAGATFSYNAINPV